MKPRGNPSQIRSRIGQYSAMESGQFDPGLFGACLGILDKLTQGRRYALIEWLYPDTNWMGKVSTRAMSIPEKTALLKWVSPSKATDTSPWAGVPSLRAEIDLIFGQIGEFIQSELPKPGQEHLGALAGEERFRDFLSKKYKGIPIMVCGCDASSKNITGAPFCVTHSEDGKNSDAYIIREIKPIEQKLIEELGYA